ncbi:hypothetical protein TYRP_011333 [Tyrophagus putrescentiae]|nr:hypothetical protein TYRP_011333 [Tyrophagus putrescentiae]
MAMCWGPRGGVCSLPGPRITTMASLVSPFRTAAPRLPRTAGHNNGEQKCTEATAAAANSKSSYKRPTLVFK